MTIRDIAALAGVSKTTVSRVLNNRPDVDAETRERVMKVVEEHGFVPSVAASTLAGRSRLIGALIPELTWPLIPEIMHGVAEVIAQTDYELVLYSVNDRNHQKDRSEILERILERKLVAGLLAIYPGQSTEYLEKLQRQGFPVVILDDQATPSERIPWVSADQRNGAYEATRYLVRLGHRRIAHIRGPLEYQVSHDRFRGYCDALAEAQIMVEPQLIETGDFTLSSGQLCAERLLTLDQRPTAIFAANDLMAQGVYFAAQSLGLRVPEEVTVVGFDDVLFASLMQPPLTTVRQPLDEMGRSAIELLLRMIETPSLPYEWKWSVSERNLSRSVFITHKTHVVVRASCKQLCTPLSLSK
ncbi:LacI family DNA-binding transcriptional regulator [Thermosporothrix hazakensis]|jgi:LacI family transcriptional regulator|nr:LacI family DNA-binding transcriptional regulator [Thermosporothrix hazakensis]